MSDRDLCFTAATQLVRMFRARDGLPVGLQIVGRRRQEAAVLGAAAAFEAAAPWADRIPPVVAGAA